MVTASAITRFTGIFDTLRIKGNLIILIKSTGGLTVVVKGIN